VNMPRPSGTRPISLLLIMLALTALPLAAQGQGPQSVPADDVPLVMHQPYRISCGDALEVIYALRNSVYRAMVSVRTDGMITLPFVDDVKAAGLRLDELSANLREAYSVVYRHPRIDVTLRHSVAARAFIGGEVAMPGIISLRKPVTVFQAVNKAGGVSNHGALSRVVVVRKMSPTETEFYELDLTDKEALVAEGGEFYLQAGDLVLVPMRNISKIRLWVRQYAYRTLALHLTTDFAYIFRWLNFDNIYRYP